jgi:ribosomal protein S18 acetylase RimI-like enzyme
MVTVERAEVTNVDIIAPLFDAYRQFYKQAPGLEAARSFIREKLKNDESVIFLAYVDGEAAGFTQLYPVFSSVSMCRSWILNDLFVDPGFRKQGVGEALLDRAKTYAAEARANGLVLETAHDNFTAQSLYEKNGWKRSQHYFYEVDL